MMTTLQITAFIWLQPLWFVALFAVVVLELVIWLRLKRHHRQWQKIVSPRLRDQLVTSRGRKRHIVSAFLLLLGLVLIICALARPIDGYEDIDTQTKGRNIVFVVDTSRSMRTADPSPSRLESARALAFELLPALSGDRISIVAFANEAFTLSPLTVDRGIIGSTLTQMGHHSIPEGGSNLAAAIQHALQMLEDSQQLGGAIILMTDGEDHDSQIDAAAERARALSIPIMAIGIGSRDGGIIPDPRRPDGQFLDDRGRPVLSTLEPEPLAKLATVSDGLFVSGNRMKNARQMILTSLDALDRIDLESRTTRLPIDRYQMFLFPGVLCLIASIIVRAIWSPLPWQKKRSQTPVNSSAAAAFIAAGIVFCPQESRADTSSLQAEIDRLSSTPETSDLQRFSGDISDRWLGRYRAKDLPNLQFLLGEQLYAEKLFPQAVEAFSEALLTDDPELEAAARYNLGNALARRGEQLMQKAESPQSPPAEVAELWRDAIAQYEESLAIDSDNPAAQENIAAIEKALEQMPPPEEQNQEQDSQSEQQDSEDSQDGGDSEESKDGESSDQQQESDSGEPSDEPPSGEGEPSDQSSSEEKEADGSNAQEQQDSSGSEAESSQKQGQDAEQSTGEQSGAQTENAAQGQPESAEGDQEQDGAEPQPGQLQDAFGQPLPTDPEQLRALQNLKDAADMAAPPRKRPNQRRKRKNNW